VVTIDLYEYYIQHEAVKSTWLLTGLAWLITEGTRAAVQLKVRKSSLMRLPFDQGVRLGGRADFLKFTLCLGYGTQVAEIRPHGRSLNFPS